MDNTPESCHSTIYYTVVETGKGESYYNQHIQGFPAAMQKKLAGYRYEADRIRYVLGRLLLLKGAAALGFGNLDLEAIRFSSHNKPFFENGFHFNLSHSGNYVFCVFNVNYRVGIDVEEIKHLELNDLGSVFSTNEKRMIDVAPDPLKQFYSFWTRKEAVIKADGRGLSIHLAGIDVTSDCLLLGETSWKLREIKLTDNYMVHMATAQLNDPEPVIYRINI